MALDAVPCSVVIIFIRPDHRESKQDDFVKNNAFIVVHKTA